MPITSLTIVPRRDTIENWNKFNPTPKDKELCVVLTKFNKCKYKIGDGKTPFKKLRYVSKISDLNEIMCFAVMTVNKTDNKNKYMRLISHIVLDPFHDTKYHTDSQDKDPYDFEIIANTERMMEEYSNGDPNESSEELPTEPLEK